MFEWETIPPEMNADEAMERARKPATEALANARSDHLRASRETFVVTFCYVRSVSECSAS